MCHDTDSQFIGVLQQDCGKSWGYAWKLPSELLAVHENQEYCACVKSSAGFLGGRGMLKIDLNIKNWKLPEAQKVPRVWKSWLCVKIQDLQLVKLCSGQNNTILSQKKKIIYTSLRNGLFSYQSADVFPFLFPFQG